MKSSYPRCILISALGLATAVTASPALAKKRPQTRPAPAVLIKPLLAQKISDAVCFAGTFEGIKVNIWDYSKAKPVPVPGLFRFGKQVTRPQPYVHVGQELTTMSLLLIRDEREHEMHDFRLQISLQGWPAPLQAAGECPLSLTDRHLKGSRHVFKADATTLTCGIDCDGGSMDVERVAGTGNVILRFHAGAGGLRMSDGCSGGQPYHVGGEAKPYDEELQKDHRPVPFRLTPMPAKACTAFRKVGNDSGKE